MLDIESTNRFDSAAHCYSFQDEANMKFHRTNRRNNPETARRDLGSAKVRNMEMQVITDRAGGSIMNTSSLLFRDEVVNIDKSSIGSLIRKDASTSAVIADSISPVLLQQAYDDQR